MLWIIGGVLIGGMVFLVWSLCAIARRADEETERMMQEYNRAADLHKGRIED